MAITYPSTLDSFTNPSGGGTLGGEGHSTIHANCYDALEALEAKVGVNNSAVTSSLDYKVSNTASVDPGHKHSPSSLTQAGATTNQALLWNGTAWAPGTPAGGGDILGPGVSVDSEIMLFSGTSGTSAKRATGTGLAKVTSGVFSVATPGTDYAQAGAITGSGNTMSTNKVLGRSTSGTGAIEELSVSGSGNVVLATGATTTNQTLTTPTINVGSDANGDILVRTGGTTSRLAKGSTNDFVYYNASGPITGNPFVYSGTLTQDSATTTAVATNASPVRQNTNGITIANVTLSAGSAGSARFRVSSDGISYSDIATVSTGGTASLSFPILLRKDYYYYVDATRTSLGGADPVATITYFR